VTQVSISTGQHQVTVNHDGGDLTYVIEKAQKLFADTKPVDPPAGPAYAGFALERRPDDAGFAWRLGDGQQPPVRAGGGEAP